MNRIIEALEDCIAVLTGEISGEAQRQGVVIEAKAAIADAAALPSDRVVEAVAKAIELQARDNWDISLANHKDAMDLARAAIAAYHKAMKEGE